MLSARTHSQGFARHGQTPREFRNHRHIVRQHGYCLQELTGRRPQPVASQHQISQFHAERDIVGRSLYQFLESGFRGVPLAALK